MIHVCPNVPGHETRTHHTSLSDPQRLVDEMTETLLIQQAEETLVLQSLSERTKGTG